ncbi:hypothetical protein WOLCODRAFT_158403 [Wolfiporia cocos MD-104 SS10]|uniref:Uncharacterized protein n=1 Tax=Wolfiporia cocos (strain MD-104) TaxID=742152 RepID=A0A2H3JMB3_WOLCO|nr:hypothetical protein WOLCODRAFT_158403 [Wolfiporia cocos MD-104 SS10]
MGTATRRTDGGETWMEHAPGMPYTPTYTLHGRHSSFASAGGATKYCRKAARVNRVGLHKRGVGKASGDECDRPRDNVGGETLDAAIDAALVGTLFIAGIPYDVSPSSSA